MPHYRIYILDEHGEPAGAVGFDCADDETAKEHAKQLLDSQDGELWRLVALFELGDMQSDPRSS
jgi:hypothetical protein